MENKGFSVSRKVVDEGKFSGSDKLPENERSYVNPWARSVEDWYDIDSPADQGRITATDGPPFPKHIQRKIGALKKLIHTNCKLEKQFYEELASLEVKYRNLEVPLYKERAKIIAGGEIPIALLDDEEAKFSETETTRGIPHFWRTCMMNSPYLAEMLEPYDLPVLSYLTDIRASCTEGRFGLDFHFDPNHYFSNSTLNVTFFKQYQKDPRSYGGIVVKGIRGTKIEWKNGNDVTAIEKLTTKKKLKKIYRPSFFQMFQIPFFLRESQNENVTETDDLKICLWYGEVGFCILDCLIPQAVLYYTKEAVETVDEEKWKETCNVIRAHNKAVFYTATKKFGK